MAKPVPARPQSSPIISVGASAVRQAGAEGWPAGQPPPPPGSPPRPDVAAPATTCPMVAPRPFQ
eukprot:6652834-Alexandrium_andersonii.AAC.1